MKPSKIIAIIMIILVIITVLIFAFVPLFIALIFAYFVACICDVMMGPPYLKGFWNILKIFDKK